MPDNPQPLVALAGDDLIYTASLASGDEDADFPIENAQSTDPALLAKSTGTTFAITITTANVSAAAIAIIQTNAISGTFQGDNLVPQALTFPGLDSGGQRIHAWQLLPEHTPGGVWLLNLTAAADVFVGRICLVVALRELNVKYGWQRGRIRPADTLITTRGGSKIYHSFGIRTNWASGVVDLHEDEELLSELDASAKGQTFPMLFIPDENTNEAWFARQMNPYSLAYPNIDVRETPLRFEEESCGPVNG